MPSGDAISAAKEQFLAKDEVRVVKFRRISSLISGEGIGTMPLVISSSNTFAAADVAAGLSSSELAER